jgi:segregation and condensation protein B
MVAKLSFRIEEIARGYQMMTLPRFQPWLAKLTAQRVQTRLSPAALETLSIVAYKQPIIRADIEAIRGVAAGEVLNRLREMGLVRIVGRAEVVGRPLLYSTTKKFLDVFGLADLDDLPPLEALNLRRRSVKADESDSAAGESATAEPSAEQDSEPLPESEPRLAASA